MWSTDVHVDFHVCVLIRGKIKSINLFGLNDVCGSLHILKLHAENEFVGFKY